MSKSASNCLVNWVNPKFRQYNKPLLLAVVVGGLTLGFVGVLTWMQAFREENCFVTTEPVSGALDVVSRLGGDIVGGTLEDMNDNTNTEARFAKTSEPTLPGCIVSVQVSAQKENGNPFKIQCTSLFENSGEYGSFIHELFRPHVCPEADQKALAPPVDNVWPDYCPSRPPEYASWTTGFPPAIAACYNRAEDCDAGGTFVTEAIYFKICPDKFVTFGAMLGYATFIEVAVTVAILLPLMACGFVESGKNSAQVQNMKEWLNELASEREQGQELAEHLS